MASASVSAAVVGCTGLVGSQILTALASTTAQSEIYAISRRTPPHSSSSIRNLIEADSQKWPQMLGSLSPTPGMFLSALGTTKAQAGSFEAQRTIDYDLNLSLARAAKESGVKVYVLISSAAVSTSSPFPYSKMKAELEIAVKKLDFDFTVIVKPGLLVGKREDTRVAEGMMRGVAKMMGSISKGWLTDWWAQDADVIGRAAVRAGMQCAQEKREKGVWMVEQGEIVKLGKTP